MIAPARLAALRALQAIEEGSLDLPAALAQSRRSLDDERDRALTAEIVTGTLRWRAAADYLIAQTAQRPLARLDPAIVTILRLSLYQLLHLTRVPASAVVDDAVDLARTVRKPSAAGFVNAVLRQVVRQRHRLPLPTRPTAAADRPAALAYLATTLSHPDWLVARWIDRFGFDAAEQIVTFNNHPPPLTVRANRLVTTREALARRLHDAGIDTAPTTWSPHGLVVTNGNPIRLGRDGSFFLQDEASQLVSLTVDARPDDRILDLCASPGGKTTALAADMGNRGVLVACDVRQRRLRLLRDTVTAAGAHVVRVVHIDRSGPVPFREVFDRVLVDAPCSGLGTVRRDPDIRWRRHADDLMQFARIQTDLLQRASRVVRPGGRLVYATCSSEPEENERVVLAFLERNPDFALVPSLDTAGPLAPLVDGEGFLRTLPFRHGLEAFFAAALVKMA